MVVVDLHLECILLPYIAFYVQAILYGKAREGRRVKEVFKKSAILI